MGGLRIVATIPPLRNSDHGQQVMIARFGTALRCSALALVATAAPWMNACAQTYDPAYPVCLHVYGPVGYFDCRYASLAQCRPLAFGHSALCIENPYFAPKSAKTAKAGRRSAR